MLNMLHKYQNGNYTVSILQDGTKIRESDEKILVADFPESLDIKITNFCDAGCSYCHEQSTVAGKHGDLDKAFEILQVLPAGTELAIGGGDPMSHPNLEEFLCKLQQKQYIANITINEKHLDKYETKLLEWESKGLITAIGISYTLDINKVIQFYKKFKHCVIHIIIGCHSSEIIKQIQKHIVKPKILLLGYKTFGRGVSYKEKFIAKVEQNILDWYRNLLFILKDNLICFDNLAIEQLKPSRLFLNQEQYDLKYMGNDGQFSMYIDFVKQEYAQASFASERTSIDKCDLQTFFKALK
jgi:hypothetical protein